MLETWVWTLGWEDPLEEGMVTHFSVPGWRIPMDRGAWWATVHRVTKSQTWLKWLSTQHAHEYDHIWKQSICRLSQLKVTGPFIQNDGVLVRWSWERCTDREHAMGTKKQRVASTPRDSGENSSCWHPDFRLQASRTSWINSVIVNHPVCSISLQQPYETNDRT